MTRQIAGRFARFFVVGASGVLINMGVLILLTDGLGCPYPISSLFAIELSILGNFALNNAWTWSDRRTTPLGERLIKYHAVPGFTAMSTNWLLLVLLTSLFKLDYRISNLIGIAAGMFLNFGLNHTWTFRGQSSGEHFNWLSIGRKQLTDGLGSSQTPQRWGIVIVTLWAAALGLRLVAMAWVPLVPEEAYKANPFWWEFLRTKNWKNKKGEQPWADIQAHVITTGRKDGDMVLYYSPSRKEYLEYADIAGAGAYFSKKRKGMAPSHLAKNSEKAAAIREHLLKDHTARTGRGRRFPKQIETSSSSHCKVLPWTMN